MRPKKRPLAPYTKEEILARVLQHFVIEGNPRCVEDAMDEPIRCVYGKTGCGIGCLMTRKDAEFIDTISDAGYSISMVYEGLRSLYNRYFEQSDQMREFLTRLQSVHDNSNLNNTMKKNMLEFVVKELRATP